MSHPEILSLRLLKQVPRCAFGKTIFGKWELVDGDDGAAGNEAAAGVKEFVEGIWGGGGDCVVFRGVYVLVAAEGERGSGLQAAGGEDGAAARVGRRGGGGIGRERFQDHRVLCFARIDSPGRDGRHVLRSFEREDGE